VRNYSYPALKQGGGAYFATDMYQGGQQLVDLVLRNRDMTFGDIAEAANGFSLAAQRRFAHNELPGRQVWIQRTSTGMGLDYWFAYAGNPNLTPSGVMGVYVPPAPPVVTGRSPDANQTDVAPETSVEATFDQPVAGVSGSSFKVADAYGLRVNGTVTYLSATRTARFTPAAPLEAGMKYKVSLNSGIRSALGATMAGNSHYFTVAGTLPAGATAYSPAAELALGVGTNTGYQFSVTGVMVASKHATLAEPVVATTTMRRTIANQGGTWFYVASGTWKGYWLQESSAATSAGASVASMPEPELFSPARTLALRKGTHTGYKFSAEGAMTTAKTATVSYREAATTELRSLPGQTGLWFRVTSGTWSGYWLRSSSVVRLIPD
jgi:hypothetical protein